MRENTTHDQSLARSEHVRYTKGPHEAGSRQKSLAQGVLSSESRGSLLSWGQLRSYRSLGIGPKIRVEAPGRTYPFLDHFVLLSGYTYKRFIARQQTGTRIGSDGCDMCGRTWLPADQTCQGKEKFIYLSKVPASLQMLEILSRPACDPPQTNSCTNHDLQKSRLRNALPGLVAVSEQSG